MRGDFGYIVTNEHGSSALVLAVFMLALLTVLGIRATRTSTIELQIAGNEKVHRQNLYLAEGGAMECAQGLEDTDLEGSPPAWLVDPQDPLDWDNDSVQSNVDPNTRYLAADEGVAPGSSLDMAQSHVHAYTVYGRCAQNRGTTVIMVGYRKAF